MPTFGLITEGPTDQVVIRYILIGIFDDPDLIVNPLQPKENEPGNWVKVFDYCCSEEFKQALAFNDYLIVQIDTDVLIREQPPEKYKIVFPNNPSVENILSAVSQKLIELINTEDGFWEQHGEKIIFAISVHQIECWFLPIYFDNQKAKAAKITGCIDTLNEILPQREKFSIHAKDLSYYTKISKHFRKEILKIYQLNFSLDHFVKQILKIRDKEENEAKASD